VPYVKYTREMVKEAVAASTSMLGVLRHFGLPQNGGAHAHLRRRIDKFGLDTSHFLGQAHFRGTSSPRRLRHDEILVVRPMDAKREKPTRLRRALEETGRSYRCTECGIGDSWHGRALTLHIDHIDGRFWDCRPENVRFLCPNCHSQTATYAGRNRRRPAHGFIRVDHQGNTVDVSESAGTLSEQERVEVLARVDLKEMTVADAARLIGCNRRHVYVLQRRLKDSGSLAPLVRRPRIPEAVREAVVAFALQHPSLGERNIATALPPQDDGQLAISPSSIRSVLTMAGLRTAEDRVAAAAGQEPSTEV
jgi:hypothetical protein